MMRKSAWVWLAGAMAWLFDGFVSLHVHATASAELAFLMALLFTIAYAFYRQQPK
jgi:hypothetical protein